MRHVSNKARLHAVIDALGSLEPNAYGNPLVQEAFSGARAPEMAFCLVRILEKDEGLSHYAGIEPAIRMLDWARIKELANQHRMTLLARGALFPKPRVGGAALYRPEILGPRFHGNAIAAGRRILQCIEKGKDGACPGSLPKRIGLETAVLLCHLAATEPGLMEHMKAALPRSVFYWRRLRPTYARRRRQDLGLFAPLFFARPPRAQRRAPRAAVSAAF